MTKLRDDVQLFMEGINQTVRTSPCNPPMREEEIKLRGRLVIEEAFEFVEALFPDVSQVLVMLKEQTKHILSRNSSRVNLPEAMDALADLDYVVEGSRLAFGVDGDNIAQAVQTANMLKLTGPDDAHGKRMKPVGWTPPDIEQCLRDQGWKEGE